MTCDRRIIGLLHRSPAPLSFVRGSIILFQLLICNPCRNESALTCHSLPEFALGLRMTRWIVRAEFLPLANGCTSHVPGVQISRSDRLNGHIVISEGRMSLGLFFVRAKFDEADFERFCRSFGAERGLVTTLQLTACAALRAWPARSYLLE